MAEFPGLGRHCGVASCNQLDFLPIRCDACRDTFCNAHFSYSAHNCETGQQKNVQVPECPLCSQPVPTPRGQLPDVAVNQHIADNCPVVQKKRIFKNKCSVEGCKKKELIPVTCPQCRNNFCLRHRHEKDHNCENRGGRIMSNSAIAALARSKQACAQQANRKDQTAMDEALARQLALEGGAASLSPEELDRRLAEQLQLEENRGGRRPQASTGNSTSNCNIS